MGSQISIFEQPIVRTTDPETSRAAARSLVEHLPEARRRALSAIASYGDSGATYHDVIAAASYTRITELHRAGLIECSGTRRAHNGRQARVWVVTAQGRELL
jgi:hypothetical protein